MKFEDRTFYDAVSRLLNIQPTHDLLSWQFLETAELVKNYLIDARKIDSDIVNQLISQNKIKQDRANCICFLGYDDNDRLAYIFRRGISSEKTFKGEVKHSSKEHSFQIIMKNNIILPEEKPPKINTLYIVEGAIDACALATLLKIKGKKNEVIQIITTAGNPHHSLKSRIENCKPDKIIIATDMDEQGRKFAKIIATMIKLIEYSTPIYDAKDPAELLLKIQSNEQK